MPAVSVSWHSAALVAASWRNMARFASPMSIRPAMRAASGVLPDDQRRDGFRARPRPMRGFGDRHQHFGAFLRRWRGPDDMQPMRDERIFQFEHRFAQPGDLSAAIGPGRLGGRQINVRGLRLDQLGQRAAFARLVRAKTPPALDRRFQVEQSAIKARMRDRRCQIADQRRRAAPLGDHALRWVVRRIEVEIRQRPDQPIRPAFRRQPRLLARHEFQRAMRAEMQHRVGAEILRDPAVEGGEGMRRGEAFLEQQAHRIALIAEGGLHADEHIAEPCAEHMDGTAIALLLAGRRSPLGFDLAKMRLAAHMIVGRNARLDIGQRAEPRRIAVDDPVAQRIDAGRHLDGVARLAHRAKHVVQRGEHRQIGRRAGIAGIGREVEQHDGDLAAADACPAQRHQLFGARHQHLHALGAGMHVAAARCREGAAAVAAGAGRIRSVGTAAE